MQTYMDIYILYMVWFLWKPDLGFLELFFGIFWTIAKN